MKILKLSSFVLQFIILPLSILFISTPFSKSTFAAWQKNSSNPVLSVGPNGSWDDAHVAAVFPTYENSEYTLWYAGHDGSRWSIGFATSSNGIDWIKNPTNPVFTYNAADPQEQHVHTPSVWKETDNSYKMWYTTSPDDATNFRIRLATSSDGFNWTRQGVVISPSQPWESGGIANPYVIKMNNVYHMWYDGFSSGTWRGGYATSSDGISWTKYAANPITQRGTASVLLDGTEFNRYYHVDGPSSIRQANSPNGLDWTDNVENPILNLGIPGSFDDFRIATPRVIKVNNTLKMYYGGHDGSTGWKVGLAEMELPTPTVPYFSQRDPLWANDQYDHLPNATMDDRGCAVTSTAMVLKYLGVTTTPGNPNTGLPPKELDPGTLNEWMTDRNDGAFRNGSMNWFLMGTMTQLNHEISPSNQKVVYRYTFNDNELDSVLTNNQHGILELSKVLDSPSRQHYVVATEKNGTNYNIHDPFYSNRTSLYPDYTTNPIKRIGFYEKTNSDFSALLFAVDPEITLELKNENGDTVGDSFIQEPIADLVNQTASEQPLRMLWLQETPSGTYTLTVSGNENQTYQLDSYLYDVDGNGGLETITGIVGPNDTDTYTILIDHDVVANSNIQQEVTLDALIHNIQTAHEMGWISKNGLATSWISLATNAQKHAEADRKTAAKQMLSNISKGLDQFKTKFVTQDAYDLLYPQVQSLINSL